jgi:hypothetical protein
MYAYRTDDLLWALYRKSDLQKLLDECMRSRRSHLSGLPCPDCGVVPIISTSQIKLDRIYLIESKPDLIQALKTLVRKHIHVLTAREYRMPTITTAHERGKPGQIYRGHFYDVETKSVLVIDKPGIPKPRLRGYLVYRQYLREQGFYLRVYEQDGSHLNRVSLTKAKTHRPTTDPKQPWADPQYVPPWEDKPRAGSGRPKATKKQDSMFTGLTGSTKPLPKPKVKRIVGKNKADIRYKLV